MTHKRTNISRRVVFLYCMLGGLIFLFLPPSVTGKVQLAYARVFRGLLATGWGVTIMSTTPPPSEVVSPQEHARLKTINRRLTNHIANLQAQLEEAQGKIDGLSRLRSVPEWNRIRFLPAGIISDPEQTENELLINRGQKDGVAVGQFVVGDMSVIGAVSDVSAQTARVRLITHPKSRIAVRVAESDARGLMAGRGAGVAAIPRVPLKREARVGDQVYALKTPGFPGIPIITAEVAASQRDPENPLLWEITVRPVSDIANLPEVMVAMSGD